VPASLNTPNSILENAVAASAKRERLGVSVLAAAIKPAKSTPPPPPATPPPPPPS